VSIIWWDIESSGLNPAFDQILQFAAIRTDDDLNEIGRFEVRSRLLPYVVPSPGALRVTGLTIDDLLDERHPSYYEMVCRVREVLAGWCPSAFVGYNSIRFDEEFLRQAFYQCLHPPYLTNTAGSKRADVLALVQTAALLHPNALAVPLSDKGRPVFKLDRLAPVNGFDHSNAHDALADVEATIFLCRLVKERCPELWGRFLRFATKDAVADLIYGADAFVLVQPSRQAAYAVTALGDHPTMNNISYCWDLRVDPRPFADLSDEELPKALAKSGSPVRKLKKNAAPSICPLDEAPDGLVPSDDRELFERRGRWVRRDRDFVMRVLRASAANETDYPPSPHVERQIYDGFWSAADGRRLQAFHAGDWGARVRVADELEDHRLAWLARRIIWVERPDLCADHHASGLAHEKARRLLADDADCAGWNSLTKASAELRNILDGLEGDPASPFLKLGEYLSQRRADCERVLGLVPA
jgi:exodeoxyribonuclease-1